MAKPDELTHLKELLGDEAVFLPIAYKTKSPVFKGWTKVTYAQTQTPQYQKDLAEAKNVGVLLCNGLVTIDFDDDTEVEPFLERYPWAADSLRTVGKRGCQIWFRIQGHYPSRRMILGKKDKKVTIEWRGGGGVQSVVLGTHPSGVEYKIVVDKPAKLIEYELIKDWVEQADFDTVSNALDELDGQPDDEDYDWLKKEFPKATLRDLDLRGLLKSLNHPTKVLNDPNKYAVKCPWHKEHSNDDKLLDATIWQYANSQYWPAFKCLHAHCEGRGLRQVLEWAETREPGIVQKYCTKVAPISFRGVDVVSYYQSTIKPEMNLLGNRWLCREGSIFVPAPSGIGKSVWVMQAAVEWALGRESFGVKPTGPLVSLILQSEDDDGDLIEMAQMLKWMNLSTTDLDLIRKNTMIEKVHTCGNGFLRQLPFYLERYKPDILWLNPYSAFSPPIMDEGENNKFLRGSITPALEHYQCGAIITHHTPKTTSQKDSEEWSYVDYSYAGAGWASITNWSRGILAIRPTHSPLMFKFIAAKRGQRIGWNGDRIRYYEHSEVPGKLLWIPSTPEDIDTVSKTQKEKKKHKKAHIETPKSPTAADKMLTLLTTETGIAYTLWKNSAMVKFSIIPVTFDKNRKILVDKGLVEQKNGLYFKV